jgi:sigma-B regulation protein RsbQ
MTPEFVDHLVVLFDLVGTGASDPDAYDATRYDSLHGHADDLLVIIDELGLRDVVFVGHSISALVGALAAIREPAFFRALVLVSASSRDDDLGYEGARRLGRTDVLLQGDTGGPSNTRGHEIQRHLVQVARVSDHRRDLGCIVTPTLVVDEAYDPIAPQAGARHLHASIPGSTLVTIPRRCQTSNAIAAADLARHIRTYVQ